MTFKEQEQITKKNSVELLSELLRAPEPENQAKNPAVPTYVRKGV